MQAVQQGAIKARPNLSDEDKLSAFIHAHEQRAKVLSCSAGRCESADDELLLGLEFELDPGAAPAAGFVSGFFALTDEAFQSELAHLFQERYARNEPG